MDDTRPDTSHDTPPIVTDQAADAGTDKPAVQDDNRPEDAPQPFEIEDAVTQTAIGDDEAAGPDDG